MWVGFAEEEATTPAFVVERYSAVTLVTVRG
jgi:hypothetical protein